MSLDRNLKYWLPVAIWMAFIFWMSTAQFSAQNTRSFIEPVIRFFLPAISQYAVEVIHGLVRKGGHLAEYFILGLLLFRAFRAGSAESHGWRWALRALVVVAVYASTDEFHQSFVPGRTASLIDVFIDTSGGALAQLISFFRIERRNRLAGK
jgi:VanZ family protein